MNLEDIVKKRNNYTEGTLIINCVKHSNMDISMRPSECELCRTDQINTLNRALRVNKFLNDLMDEIEIYATKMVGLITCSVSDEDGLTCKDRLPYQFLLWCHECQSRELLEKDGL